MGGSGSKGVLASCLIGEADDDPDNEEVDEQPKKVSSRSSSPEKQPAPTQIAKEGSSDWMDAITFKEGKMCAPKGPLMIPVYDDETAQVDLAVISLGCYCGIKLSFRKLGLLAETLPFDWNRTRIEKVIEFLQTDFEGFFRNVRGPIPVPGTSLAAFRGEGHSFWHDDIQDAAVRSKLNRRISRFLAVGRSASKLLYVRALATTDELAHADRLYATLVQKCRDGNPSNVFLLLIVCFQTQERLFKSAISPGLFIYFLTDDAHVGVDGGSEPAPFCQAIGWVHREISRGCGNQMAVKQVRNASSLLQSDLLTYCDFGLQGMNGIRSFEENTGTANARPQGQGLMSRPSIPPAEMQLGSSPLHTRNSF